MAWLIYDLTGSAKDIGWLVIVYTAPVIMGGPLAGISTVFPSILPEDKLTTPDGWRRCGFIADLVF